MMEALLRQVLFGGSETRLLALRVCRRVLPWVELDNVDEKLRSITQECGLVFDETFVEAFLRLIGETADVLGRGLSGISLAKENPYAARDEAAPLGATASMMDMLLARSTCPAIRVRVSSKVAFSLSRELISLFHELVAAWSDRSTPGMERTYIQCSLDLAATQRTARRDTPEP